MPTLSRGHAPAAPPERVADVVELDERLRTADVWPLSPPRRRALAAQLLGTHDAAAIVAAIEWHVGRGRPGAWIAKLLADPVGVERTLSAMGWRLRLQDVDDGATKGKDGQRPTLPDGALCARAVEVLLLRAGLFTRAPAERAAIADRLVRVQRFTADDVATFLAAHVRAGRSAAWIATKLRREPEAVARALKAARPVEVGPVNWIMRRRIEAMTALLASRRTVEGAPAVAVAPAAGVASAASHDFQREEAATVPRLAPSIHRATGAARHLEA